MSILINELRYLTASDVSDRLDVSRQTLWRWRREGKIPRGHRYRKYVVYTPKEVEAIEAFANQIDPIEPAENPQNDLFENKDEVSR